VAESEEAESLWDDYDARPQAAEIPCKAHGVVCKRGICMEYDKQMKEILWAARAEKGDGGRGRGKRGHGKGGGGRKDKSNNSRKASSASQGKDGWDSQSGWDNKSGWDNEGASTSSSVGGNDATGDTSGVSVPGSAKGGKCHIGRMRACSNSSQGESAPGTTDGWDDVSNGPW